MTSEDDLSSVGCGHMHVDHLDGGELCQGGWRREPWGETLEPTCERHLQVVGEEGDEDVGFNALVALMKDRTDGEVALEGPERLLYIPLTLPLIN